MSLATDDDAYSELVGVFRSEADLEQAIGTLTSSGWDHAELSLLAHHRVLLPEHVQAGTAELADSPDTERQGPVSDTDMRQTRTLLAGTVGVAAAFLASGATIMTGGGTLAAIVGAAVLGGGAGGLVEVLGQHARSERDRFLHEQIEQGGILLWVRVRRRAEERKARDILARCGASDIHVHGGLESGDTDNEPG